MAARCPFCDEYLWTDEKWAGDLAELRRRLDAHKTGAETQTATKACWLHSCILNDMWQARDRHDELSPSHFNWKCICGHEQRTSKRNVWYRSDTAFFLHILEDPAHHRAVLKLKELAHA